MEAECNFSRKLVSILINIRSYKSYVSPSIIDQWPLQKSKNKQALLVQFAIGTKKKVFELINGYIEFGEMSTTKTLNVLPFGSTSTRPEKVAI